jgi:hypothetical protein
MPTLLDDALDQNPAAPADTSIAAERLRTSMAAARVAFTWFGTRKTLSPQQKEQAADAFGAEGAFLSAGKKLLDTSHEAFKAVTAVRGKIAAYWRGISLPYPEPGIRLVRQDAIGPFDQQLTEYKAELDRAVTQLDNHYSELVDAARDRLGTLFNRADYPVTLRGAFEVSWDFPSVEPPEYLRQLNPQLYRQECERVRSRFDEAVRLAEEAFVAELAKLVSHLSERLSGQEDGRPKIFRDSAVENLSEFFNRFRDLNISSSLQLDSLVAQAQRTVRGVGPQALRDNAALRQQVATQLAGVQSVLDGLMVDRPRRNILRRPAS